MAELSLRTTYKYKLKPLPAQARMLDGIVWACGRVADSTLRRWNNASCSSANAVARSHATRRKLR